MKFVSVVLLFFAIVIVAKPQAATGQCASKLVDGSVYRIIDQLFSASNIDVEYPPYLARESSDHAWCTDSLGNSDSPWLEVNFGAEVHIIQIATGGLDNFVPFSDEYVRSYRIQYSTGDGSLMDVIDSATNQPKVFARSDDDAIETTDLPTNITAERLRIVISPGSWTNNRACLRLEVYGCPVNEVCSSLNLLTTNRTLLPLDTITASSDNGNTPQELVDTSGGVWCSTQSLQTRPYIQLNFTQPVTIIYMMARGLSSSSFVSEFSIELLEESIEHLYQQPNNITSFQSANSDFNTFTFWQPLKINSIVKFNILDAEDPSDFCWNVRLFGCVSSADQETVAVTTSTPYMHSTTYNTMLLTSSSSVTSTLPDLVYHQSSPVPSSSNRLITRPVVAIAASVTTVILVALGTCILIIVIVVIALMNLKRQNKSTKTTEVYFNVDNNDLYYSPEIDANGVRINLASVDNTYETVENNLEHYEPVSMLKATLPTHQSSSAELNHYESRGKNSCEKDQNASVVEEKDSNMSKIEQITEHSTHKSDVLVSTDDSDMVDNPMYGSTTVKTSTQTDDDMVDNPMYGSTSW